MRLMRAERVDSSLLQVPQSSPRTYGLPQLIDKGPPRTISALPAHATVSRTSVALFHRLGCTVPRRAVPAECCSGTASHARRARRPDGALRTGECLAFADRASREANRPPGEHGRADCSRGLSPRLPPPRRRCRARCRLACGACWCDGGPAGGGGSARRSGDGGLVALRDCRRRRLRRRCVPCSCALLVASPGI